MSVSSTDNRISYLASGPTTTFAFPYYFQKDIDLKVVHTDADGVETTLSLEDGDYTIDGFQDPSGRYVSGADVVTTVAIPDGERLTIYRDPELTQDLDLAESGSLPAEEMEKALDRLMMVAQRLKERMERSIRLPEGYSGSFSPIIESVPSAGKTIVVADDGLSFIEGPSAADIAGAEADAATASAAATSAAASAVTAASSQSAAASSATAAAASAVTASVQASTAGGYATDAAVKASAAATSATSASSSATSAGGSATSASGAANAALTSQTAAATSATNAATSATNAANSATAAATSATNAANSATAAAASAAAIVHATTRYSSANHTIANNTLTPLKCTSLGFNNGGNTYDTSTGRYTITAGNAGRYLVRAYATVGSSTWAVATSMDMGLRKNNTGFYGTMGRHRVQTTTSYAKDVFGSIMIDLAVGDYVEVLVSHNSGGTETLNGSATENWVEFQKVN